ncbi:MAG: peptide chain release factor N(5)-glutamine methyltransferase [Nitrospirae bacterium]|nr:peptide chain release factor N(5)-glutamine methyltransferase [Nitrospirota bacterium]
MKAINKVREVTGILREYGIEGARKEAEILIAYGAGIEALEMYRDNPDMTDSQIYAAEKLLSRRLLREPLSYIIGHEEFMDLTLEVGDGVLIPRPETELMAEHALKKRGAHTILDLCTGSGCLALALAMGIPSSQVYGVDISDVAIGYAKRNALRNNISNVTFLHGDLFEPFKDKKFFDLIISNPPYIRSGDIIGLQPEIREWESKTALDGGEDGLDFYRRIILSASGYLKDRGRLMLEIGAGQSDDTAEMIRSAGYSCFRIIKDYNGIERIVEAEWRN